MTSMAINTKAGSVELVVKAPAVSKEELNANLRLAQSFLTEIQARVEQMHLNSEQDKSDWDEAFRILITQIPEELVSEVKRVLSRGLSQIKVLMEPEKTWELLQEIYGTLDATVNNLAISCS